MKWQKTSLLVVCLSLRLSTFEAGAAQERGAANSHSAAKKRLMPPKVVIAVVIGRIMEGAARKMRWNLEIVYLYMSIYIARRCGAVHAVRSYLISDFEYSGTFYFGGVALSLFLHSRAIPSTPGIYSQRIPHQFPSLASVL